MICIRHMDGRLLPQSSLQLTPLSSEQLGNLASAAVHVCSFLLCAYMVVITIALDCPLTFSTSHIVSLPVFHGHAENISVNYSVYMVSAGRCDGMFAPTNPRK